MQTLDLPVIEAAPRPRLTMNELLSRVERTCSYLAVEIARKRVRSGLWTGRHDVLSDSLRQLEPAERVKLWKAAC